MLGVVIGLAGAALAHCQGSVSQLLLLEGGELLRYVGRHYLPSLSLSLFLPLSIPLSLPLCLQTTIDFIGYVAKDPVHERGMPIM